MAGTACRLAHHVGFMLTFGRWPDYLRHSCDNPPCCNPWHSTESTHQENVADHVAKGRQTRGEEHGPSKLTTKEVLAIRADSRGCRRLARVYGVSSSQIARIRNGTSWSHT
jgi:hypothetical protein